MAPVVAYEAVNKINGHRYVGVTAAGMTARRRGHRHAAKSGSVSKAIKRKGTLHGRSFLILETRP